jgi:hypothetical protein
MWSSIHAKGYTLIIIITLVFAVVYGPHHHVTTRLVGTTVTSQIVQCPSRLTCPPVIVDVRAVLLPGDGPAARGGVGDTGRGGSRADRGGDVWVGAGNGR